MTRTIVCARLRKNFFEVRLQTRAHQRIERAERLIEQEQLGLEHQRTHQADALPLSARELDRVALEILSHEARELAEFRQRALISSEAGERKMPRHEGDVFARGEVRK